MRVDEVGIGRDEKEVSIWLEGAETADSSIPRVASVLGSE
jgi:hypothetical protein